MLNVEDDPAYADLMNGLLDRIEDGVGSRQGKMVNRAAFVIISSPNSVTPVHFDMEHSLLMQVSGSRTITVGRFEDRAACQFEIDRYFDGSHGRIASLPEEVRKYQLKPGTGVYIPRAIPHWLHNGPAPSISITLTYFTTKTLRENRIEDLNARLRRLKLSPRPAGQSAPVDAAKAAAIRFSGIARQFRRPLARRAGPRR